jgi:uncharacterized protein
MLYSSPHLLALAALLALLGLPCSAQVEPFPGPGVQELYERLLSQIRNIKMLDHHAHPGYFDDPDVDAMTEPPNTSEPLRLRSDNHELVIAAKALFGYPYDDLAPGHARWLKDKKAQSRKTGGYGYFDRILDQLGIETSIANRVAMPDYLNPARFRWVFFVDSFLFPFENRRVEAQNSDEQTFIPMQEAVLHRYMKQAQLTKLPADLNGYVSFISRILEENKRRGGIAMKFEVAYFRSLNFGDPPREAAAAIYRRYVQAGEPSAEEYKTFQDWIFRYLITEGGRLGLPVHIHSAVGTGNYFNLSTGNPLNLENILRDPRYSNTIFVLIHGGLPFEHQVAFLAAVPNVYLDSSETEHILFPAEFKRLLRFWLETYPEKITFGTDAFPYNEIVSTEETYWTGVESSQKALAAALAEMVSCGEITPAKAVEFARGYLHDNAAKIYAH